MKNRRINKTATVNAVKLVFPPSATPVALSTYVVTVGVPGIAPAAVPTGS